MKEINTYSALKRLLELFCKSVGLDASYSTKAIAALTTKLTLFEMQEGDEQLFADLIAYYEKTVLPHKIAVFNEGMKIKEAFGLEETEVKDILLFHDFSKFDVQEIAYAYVDFANFKSNSEKVLSDFKFAWHHHKMHNPHHPEYWFAIKKDGQTQALPIPRRYLAEMIADWMGAGTTYGSSLEDWLSGNLSNFRFHKKSASDLSDMLVKYLKIETTFKDESLEVLQLVSRSTMPKVQ